MSSPTAAQPKTSPRPEFLVISPESSLTQPHLPQSNGLAGQPIHDGHQSPGMDNTNGITADLSHKYTSKPNGRKIDGEKQNGESYLNGKHQENNEDENTATATEYRGSVVSGSKDEGPCSDGRPPRVMKAKMERKLSKLLTSFATTNTVYSGLDMSPSSPTEHLPSLPSLKSTPDSQPPSLYFGTPTPDDVPLMHILSRAVSKDGKTTRGAASRSPAGGVWTLRSQEGRLYLFNNQGREKGEEGEEEEEEEEEEGEEEEEDDSEEEDSAEGIELSSVLAEENGGSCNEYYHQFCFNIPTMVLDCEVDNPHLTPVYTPSAVEQYSLCKKPVGDDSGWILHHDAVLLVLQEDTDPPTINAVQKGELVSLLERMEKERKSSTSPSYNPVINIKFITGKTGNNMALFFNGKEYRYYIHVKGDTKELIAFRTQYSCKEDDWRNHLQFTNHYHTPGDCPPKATQQDFASTHGHVGGATPSVTRKGEKRMTTIDESDELAGQRGMEGTDGEVVREGGGDGGEGEVRKEVAEMEKERKLETREGEEEMKSVESGEGKKERL